ncbi:MAG: TonB-dependent receptor [Opitutaceae bacterium]|nr:TonB-dependent receptor [Opitutaceae bacterium]
MNVVRFSFSACIATTTLSAQTAHSRQHSDEEPLHLDRFVISTSPYARSQDEIAQSVSVLDGNRLAQRQATSLGELLAGETGVASSYFGPGASRPIVRGIGGDRLKVLENGVGTIDASITSPDHAVSLDPLLIEKVEVVRGPAALLYGGNAIAGVVNTITHRIHETRPDKPLEGRLEVRSQSVNDEKSAGLLLEGAAGAFAWHIDGFRRSTADLKIPGFAESARLRAIEQDEGENGSDPEREAHGRIPNTAIHSDGGATGLSWIGRDAFVGFAWSGYNTLYGIPSGAHDHEQEQGDGHQATDGHGMSAGGADAEEGVKIDLVQRRFDAQGALTRSIGVLRGVRFKAGSSNYRHQEIEDGTIGTVFRNRGYDARVEILHQPISGFSGEMGWQGSHSDFSALGDEAFVPPSRTDAQAMFLLEEVSTGNATLQFGARLETQGIALRDGSGFTHRETLPSLSGNSVWRLPGNWILSVSLARSTRSPNAQERYANGPHPGTNAYEIGSPDLDVETSYSIDTALRHRIGRITGAITLFANRFDGFAYAKPTGQFAVSQDDKMVLLVEASNPASDQGLAVYRYAQTDATFMGVEGEMFLHLHERGVNTLDVRLSTDYVRARDDDSGDPLPRITPRRTKVGLDWAHGPASLSAEAQFVSAQHRVASHELPTDGYTLLNADASYRFATGQVDYTMFIRGSNLGNEEARAHTSFLKEIAPLPGRSVNLGVRMSF